MARGLVAAHLPFARSRNQPGICLAGAKVKWPAINAAEVTVQKSLISRRSPECPPTGSATGRSEAVTRWAQNFDPGDPLVC
jgi:hypothetical protein